MDKYVIRDWIVILLYVIVVNDDLEGVFGSNAMADLWTYPQPIHILSTGYPHKNRLCGIFFVFFSKKISFFLLNLYLVADSLIGMLFLGDSYHVFYLS